jgi:hypothetical protein
MSRGFRPYLLECIIVVEEHRSLQLFGYLTCIQGSKIHIQNFVWNLRKWVISETQAYMGDSIKTCNRETDNGAGRWFELSHNVI